jgi:hypothetical protein
MEVSVHDTTVFETKSILYIYITVEFTADIAVVTDDITLYYGCAAYNNLSLYLEGSLEHTVDTDVIRRDDLTFDDRTG